jgi:4-hydroxy-3-polyprenylbenzoate decarboxylase
LTGSKARIVVGVSGSSGVIYGIRLLQVLRDLEGIETHLIMSNAAKQTILLETDYAVEAVEALADKCYRFNDIAAAISSGSFRTRGMVVIPCSMKTLAGIALSFSDNLLVRAADVTLKERRRLVIVPRETPLHLGHLRLMAQAAEIGAILVPPVPAFYHLPQTLDDIINQTINRVLDLLEIELPNDLFKRWSGPPYAPSRRRGGDHHMMPREAWEQEESERLLAIIRQRRKALEDFATALPTLMATATGDAARAKIEPLANRLDSLLRNFHMDNLDELEQLRAEIERLAHA